MVPVVGALLWTACRNGMATSPSSRPFLASNPPPVLQSITWTGDRVEVDDAIELTAHVSDGETSPGDLVYNWSSTGGTFTGSGSTVRWRAPSVAVPDAHRVKLDVLERYVLVGAGRPVPAENQVTHTLTVRVNDSPTELRKLAFTFINDFVHPDRAPEYCVRNFSDHCVGKAEELGDVRRNRLEFIVNPTASSFTFRSMTFNTPADVPAHATFATVRLNCRFVSIRRETGLTEIADGTCRLTNVYEDFRWRLCDSRFDPPAGLDSQFVF